MKFETIVHVAVKVLGIPKDDSFFISESADQNYTVNLTNNMRELINTTHVIKSVGRFERSNEFYAVAKRRDTSNMVESLHKISRWNKTGSMIPWIASTICERQFISLVREGPLPNEFMIGGKNTVEIIGTSGQTLRRCAVNGFVASIENIGKLVYISSVNDTSYLVDQTLKHLDSVPFGSKHSSKTLLFNGKIVLHRDALKPSVLEVKQI